MRSGRFAGDQAGKRVQRLWLRRDNRSFGNQVHSGRRRDLHPVALRHAFEQACSRARGKAIPFDGVIDFAPGDVATLRWFGCFFLEKHVVSLLALVALGERLPAAGEGFGAPPAVQVVFNPQH